MLKTQSIMLALTLLCCSSAVQAQRGWPYPPAFEDADEHVYRTVGDVTLKAWVFRPESVAPAGGYPAIVFFFGGGWQGGTPAQFAKQCRYFQSRGMVAVACDYRVASRHGVKAVDCVEDAKSAVRWLRASAAGLQIDPQRICASGGSAGGHIAACTGVVSGLNANGEDLAISSVPNAMALFNPAVMLAPLEGAELTAKQAERLKNLKQRTGVEPVQISPIHHIGAGQPPTIIFHGTADRTVPIAGVEEFTRRSQAAGNQVTLHSYEGAPHGFFNDRGRDEKSRDDARQWYRGTVEQLDRFLTGMGWIAGEPAERRVSRHVRVRRYLDASRHRFEVEQTGRVAFLGGSITEMNGYRPQVESWLQDQFPKTDFEFINAGIASTCSHTGAFRLQRDVLSHGQVDLLFVEFAVNDDQDAGHSADGCIRGMEGVIRQALSKNPRMDIVMIHFPNDGMLKTIAAGEEPLSSQQHESIARRYGVSSIYLSRIVAQAIERGELTWQEYGGTHPKPPGNTLTAKLVAELLQAGWRFGCQPSPVASFKLPDALDDASYFSGRLVAAADAGVEMSDGWTRSVPDWKQLPGSKRSRFMGEVMLHADDPGAQLMFGFDGTAVGAYVLAGPDSGAIEYRIDSADWQTAVVYHHFSRGLHYPRTVMFGTGLDIGEHRLELRTVGAKSENRGSAMRILAFAVNE